MSRPRKLPKLSNPGCGRRGFCHYVPCAVCGVLVHTHSNVQSRRTCSEPCREINIHAVMRDYMRRNPEPNRAAQSRHKKKHKGRVKKRKTSHYFRNKEYYTEYHRRYYRKNRTKILKQQKEHRESR